MSKINLKTVEQFLNEKEMKQVVGGCGNCSQNGSCSGSCQLPNGSSGQCYFNDWPSPACYCTSA